MESITKVLKHYRFNVFNFSVVVSPLALDSTK
jgi:hypothetical protein